MGYRVDAVYGVAQKTQAFGNKWQLDNSLIGKPMAGPFLAGYST
jgi:hypothetical protein